MKILQIIDTLRSGGRERQLIETLKFLSGIDGINSELIVMSDDIHYEYIDDLNIKTYSVIRRSKKDPSVFFKFYRLFRETRPDIIHSWGSMCSVYSVIAAKILGIKFVNGFLRNAPASLSMKNKEWIRAKLTFPFSDKIAANSFAGLKAYNVPEKKSVCLHNGFDFNRIDGLDKKETIREKFDIHTKFVVGMVATFSDKKDYSTFIKSAHLILEKRDDVTFVAIGNGEYLEDIKKLIKPKFKKGIRLLGKQKRVLNIVNLFDIGILTTNTRVHGEGIPNVVMEYMALKKPVISSDCGGNRELIIDNYTGFLVDPENPQLLKEKISLLLDNNILAEEFGQNGYWKLQKEFNLETMGRAFLTLYRGM